MKRPIRTSALAMTFLGVGYSLLVAGCFGSTDPGDETSIVGEAAQAIGSCPNYANFFPPVAQLGACGDAFSAPAAAEDACAALCAQSASCTSTPVVTTCHPAGQRHRYTFDCLCVAAPTCSDGIQNQGENGVDCGGPCPACPTCSDGIQNQGEDGVDCGGPCAACPTCNDGIQNQGEDGVDCGGPCAACPTCSDGIQNQGETGVDCGGPCAACSTCNDGIQNQGETGVDCGGPCAACPTCSDGIQNQGETGVDCGGPCAACPTCSDGIQNQGESGVDCGGPCAACATCSDGIKNQTETDVDCGGGTCGTCALGKACIVDNDCTSNACFNNVCSCGNNHVVISEVLSRSTGGGNDEYIELYNPTSSPITLDNTWKIDARSNTAAGYTVRWTGSGQVIPAHGHYLIVGSSYSGAVAGDATLSTGITDATSLVLQKSGVTIDNICYAYSAGTVSALQGAGYICEGTPIGNNPHNDSTGTNVNQSLERKPGGASGNCTDTGVNTADYFIAAPSNPQNRFSAPTL